MFHSKMLTIVDTLSSTIDFLFLPPKQTKFQGRQFPKKLTFFEKAPNPILQRELEKRGKIETELNGQREKPTK